MMRIAIATALIIAAMCGSPTAAAEEIIAFQTPSGNVVCSSSVAEVRCDIRERDWSPPARPADCSTMTGYGQGIVLPASGRPDFVCGGDTVLRDDDGVYVLEYGDRHSVPAYTCESAPSGLTCTNLDDHGFTISRQSYRLF